MERLAQVKTAPAPAAGELGKMSRLSRSLKPAQAAVTPISKMKTRQRVAFNGRVFA